MAGTRRRRQLQRQRQRKELSAEHWAATAARIKRLPPYLLAEIHRRLDFLRRLAFASLCGAAGQSLREPPWLLLPGPHEPPSYAGKATVLSLADGGRSAAVRTSDNAALRGHVAVGSSGGWLVTADDKGALRMANPVTGAHADLPAITTSAFVAPKFGGGWFILDVERIEQIRFTGGGGAPPPEHRNGPRTFTVTAAQMRQVVYRKVVLSSSPRPAGSYAAMLIMHRSVAGGAPAFATAEDAAWRFAPSPSGDGVEDAVHHNGRFLSITYTGHVEAWRRDADTGEFAAVAVAGAPRLDYEDTQLRRKYLAVSPDGRLMVVLKHSRCEEKPSRKHTWSTVKNTRVFFKVQMLDHDTGRWEEAADIGDAAVFVGVNGSLCLSAREHRGIKPGCVYFTDDDVGDACLRNATSSGNSNDGDDDTGPIDELRNIGVYSLKAGRVERIGGVRKNQLWPPPAWFTPSFL